MSDLGPEDVRAMAAAIGLSMTADDLVEVTHRLNGLLQALQALDGLPLDEVEPLPVLPDEAGPR